MEARKPENAPTLLDGHGNPLEEAAPAPRWKSWTTDHSLIATIALSVISLCALIVSIYQARVLSSQQRAMEAQQEIMIQNAKAQLWPSLQIGLSVNGLGEQGVELDLELGNSGTGPAIIEGLQVAFRG